MKMYLISDNHDTVTGMRLCGVEGIVVSAPQELKTAFDDVLGRRDVGILLLTEKLSKWQPEYVKTIKLERRVPLLVEIPDRHGTGRIPNFITEYVHEAIGLKL